MQVVYIWDWRDLVYVLCLCKVNATGYPPFSFFGTHLRCLPLVRLKTAVTNHTIKNNTYKAAVWLQLMILITDILGFFFLLLQNIYKGYFGKKFKTKTKKI